MSLPDERFEDLVVAREPLLLLLREDDASVRDHVELAPTALAGVRLVLGSPVDLGRETRGPLVVSLSDGAVVDLDSHVGTLVAASDAALWGEECARRLLAPRPV
jgi:hypothetical protein